MSVLVKESDGTDEKGNKLLVKGAPGMLLERCTHLKLRDGKTIPISVEARGQITSTIESIGGRALHRWQRPRRRRAAERGAVGHGAAA